MIVSLFVVEYCRVAWLSGVYMCLVTIIRNSFLLYPYFFKSEKTNRFKRNIKSECVPAGSTRSLLPVATDDQRIVLAAEPETVRQTGLHFR